MWGPKQINISSLLRTGTSWALLPVSQLRSTVATMVKTYDAIKWIPPSSVRFCSKLSAIFLLVTVPLTSLSPQDLCRCCTSQTHGIIPWGCAGWAWQPSCMHVCIVIVRHNTDQSLTSNVVFKQGEVDCSHSKSMTSLVHTHIQYRHTYMFIQKHMTHAKQIPTRQ